MSLTILLAVGEPRDHRRPLHKFKSVSCLRGDLSPRIFNLRTGGAGDKETGLGTLSQSKHVQGTHERGLERLDRVDLVVWWGCRAGKMIDFWKNGGMIRMIQDERFKS